MNGKQLSSLTWKLLGVILLFLSIDPATSLAKSREIDLQNQQFSEDLVKQRVSTLIHRIAENSQIRLKDGSYATPMPLLPSNDELREVKGYGDRAVTVLATYSDSSQGLEQHLAVRFLLEFHNDSALAALRAFAEKSKIGGIREEAVAALTGFPPEKVKRIVEHISTSDPDPEVRAYARRVFATFPVSDESQK